MPSTIRGSDNFDTAGGNAVKAWVNFNGTGTVAIRAAYNVTSITDNGTGDYTVNFTTALSDANYAALVVNGGANTVDIAKIYNPGTPQTASLVRVLSLSNAFNAADSNYMNVAIFR